MDKRDYPNPGIAAVLSFLFTGLGQIYNGQIGKGLTLMSISMINMLMLVVGAVIATIFIIDKSTTSTGNLMLGIALIAVSITCMAIAGFYNIYDAYHTAAKR